MFAGIPTGALLFVNSVITPMEIQMPILDFQTVMLPVLQLAGDGAEHRIADMRERLAADLKLTTDDLAEKLKSGNPLFANRVAWAVVYLKKAELLKSTATRVYQITDRGAILLNRKLPKITIKTLFDGGFENEPDPSEQDVLTPDEQTEGSFNSLGNVLDS